MSHNCQPPSVNAERWTCTGCGRTWVAHGHGWRVVPEFVPMTSAVGVVEVRVNDHPAHATTTAHVPGQLPDGRPACPSCQGR